MKISIRIIVFAIVFSSLFSCSQAPQEETEEEMGFKYYPEESIHHQTEEKQDTNKLQDIVSFRGLAGYVQPKMNKEDYEWVDGHAIIDWTDHLANVVFIDKHVGDSLFVKYPQFHDKVKALDGQKVQIKGYLIKLLDESPQLHILSAFPMSQCFFCGKSGLESIMDVLTIKKHPDFNMDDIITFRGTLHLNDTDMEFMNYMLKDAAIVDYKESETKPNLPKMTEDGFDFPENNH